MESDILNQLLFCGTSKIPSHEVLFPRGVK